MSSSKGSDDEEDTERSIGFSISTFMFGNVDENGDLVDEYLDGSQKMLGNLGNILNCDDMVTENDMVRIIKILELPYTYLLIFLMFLNNLNWLAC
jgi:hypothetical protein